MNSHFHSSHSRHSRNSQNSQNSQTSQNSDHFEFDNVEQPRMCAALNLLLTI